MFGRSPPPTPVAAAFTRALPTPPPSRSSSSSLTSSSSSFPSSTAVHSPRLAGFSTLARMNFANATTAARSHGVAPLRPPLVASQLQSGRAAVPGDYADTKMQAPLLETRGSAHALLSLMEHSASRASGGASNSSNKSVASQMMRTPLEGRRSFHEYPRHSSSHAHADDALSTASTTSLSSSDSRDHNNSNDFEMESRRDKKRAGDATEPPDSDNDSVHTVQSVASSTVSKKKTYKRKFRKATHTVRKVRFYGGHMQCEEKERLLVELEKLQAEMDKLKERALASRGEMSQTRAQKKLANTILRDSLQDQLTKFADAQALFSEYGMTQVISPISTAIRLGKNRSDRLAYLTSIKEKKLRASQEFLRRRCGGLDTHKQYSEDQRFETPTGDFCAIRFSIVQFEGVQSVKQVFDILHFYFCNIEISISEKLGNITIREDDDMQDKSISQNRLVGTSANNVLLESNTIMFSEYRERDDEFGDGREYAIIAAEFVDEDELYPYRPAQRVRKDITAILQLTSYTRMVKNMFNGDVEELVVVLTRWSHSRLIRPHFKIPVTSVMEMREGMERWGESMCKTMRETLYPDA
ncbi:hypothetical protein FI667_g7639, partial [Globisporangium splendens]